MRYEAPQGRFVAYAWVQPNTGDPRVRALCEKMQHGLATDGSMPTLSRFCKNASVSAPHLSRIYKRACGASFREDATRLRMHSACQLLLATDLSVKQVAFAVGYKHASDLCHRFKRFTGMTPSEYRVTSAK